MGLPWRILQPDNGREITQQGHTYQSHDVSGYAVKLSALFGVIYSMKYNTKLIHFGPITTPYLADEHLHSMACNRQVCRPNIPSFLVIQLDVRLN